jgi:tetratricopeptide (TPR) repeat protein
MSLGSKVNVRISLIILLGLLLCTSTRIDGPIVAYADVTYSEVELKSIESQDESKIRDLRNQEIKQLRLALGLRNPEKRKADLFFRLAELYIEAYRAAYILEGRVHEKRLSTGVTDKAADHSRSQNFLKLAIKACEEIIQTGIVHSHMDQVYYFLGFNHAELGHQKESRKYFELLTKKYPNSDFAAESHRELGEMAFRSGQYREAIEELEIAVSHASKDVMPRVLHKLSWSYYRVKAYAKAVATMKKAVESASQSGEKFVNLKEEGLRDMAIFMTETGQVSEAVDYFNKVAGDKEFYPQILERLGKQYERNVEAGKATQVYEALMKARPNTDSAFRVLVKLVDLDLRQKKFKEALARVQNLKIPSSKENETLVALQNLRAMIRRTATENHELYRKKKIKQALEVAEAYYTSYLTQFLVLEDVRNETPEIQMYLAETKAELGKSKEASALYKKVLESKDKRYAKEAGVLWTASLAETIKKAQGQIKFKQPMPSELEREFIDASDQLVENLPETKEAKEAALKSAQVLAGYKDTEKEAIKRTKKIIEQWPTSPQATVAARLLLQIYSDQGDFESLRATVQELRENKTLMASDGKLKAYMGDAELKLRIHKIGQFEKGKDFASAAKNYESLAAETPQQDLSEKAFANAVSAYGKAGDAASAARVSQAWLKRFPKSKQALDSIRDSGIQERSF